jgi:hypothetical protein
VHRLTLVSAPLGEASGWLTEIRRGWQANLDRLDATLRSRLRYRWSGEQTVGAASAQ